MTDAERLKVACEIINREGIRSVSLGDLNVRWCLPNFIAQAGQYGTKNRDIACACCSDLKNHAPALIDCIILARQKLAAEREAAMTPREKKWRAALEEICQAYTEVGWCERHTYDIARKALEES